MFTGIIESLGKVETVSIDGSNIRFTFSCSFVHELKIDQSLAHDGCCLTVEHVNEHTYTVTAIDETLKKTNLKSWKAGSLVNLERCMQMNGRMDGHIVQGHVDRVGEVLSIENKDGSFVFKIGYEGQKFYTTVPQGSITVNGISLTVSESGEDSFCVAIIPYTWEHTNLKCLKIGDQVNLEFDIIGKYVAKLMDQRDGIK